MHSHEGMHIELIADRQYQAAVLSALQKAKKSVDVVQLEFFSDSGFCQSVADRLMRLKQSHPRMKIRVFLEGFRRGISDRNADTQKKLEGAGIQVKLGSSNRVVHAKAVVIDHHTVLSGSHNLSNQSILRNNETSLLVESSELGRQLKRYVDALFEEPSKNHASASHENSTTLLLDSACYDAVIGMIQKARSTIDLAMYYIAYSDPSDRVVQALLDELVHAHDRGVHIRLLLEQGSPYLPYITAGNKRAAATLLRRGLSEIYFDPYRIVSHAKYMIRDRSEALLGSTNWYDKDFYVHHQINFKTRDKKIALGLTRLFEKKLSEQTSRFVMPAA